MAYSGTAAQHLWQVLTKYKIAFLFTTYGSTMILSVSWIYRALKSEGIDVEAS
jgi:hypothetical protein